MTKAKTTLIRVAVNIAIVWAPGAFISADPTWFITEVGGRFVLFLLGLSSWLVWLLSSPTWGTR